MDHLPHGGHKLNIVVPYVCTYEYDYEKEWVDYPSLRGFDVQKFFSPDFRRMDPKKLEPFLQSWLFFGMLGSILRTRITTTDFARDVSPGNRVITTAELPEYLNKWNESISTKSKAEKDVLLRENMLTIRKAAPLIHFLLDWCEPSTIFPFRPVSKEIALSFALLGRALSGVLRHIFRPEWKFLTRDEDGSLPDNWSSGNKLFWDHLIALGWCPYLLSRLDSVPVDVQYYLATLGPPAILKSHRRCTEEICRVLVREKNIREPKHVRQGCDCQELGLDMDKLISILQKDEAVLVRFNNTANVGESPSGTIEILEYEPSIPYVALSHVWTDGLGNPKSNSLPICQVAAIQDSVNQVYSQEFGAPPGNLPVTFWMDTLCVPGSNNYPEIKTQAIFNMRYVYALASHVLVFDSGLSACSKAADPIEIVLRVTMSNWFRRLWTFQEALFAQSIMVRLSDGIISLTGFVNEECPTYVGNDLRPAVVEMLSSIFDADNAGHYLATVMRSFDHPYAEKIAVRAITGIVSRSTSVQEDEAHVLAFIFPVEPISVLTAEAADKLPTLFSLLKQIPPCIIFLPGPRLERDRFRWLPKSFLGKNLLSNSTLMCHNFVLPGTQQERVSGSLGPHGLRVMFPGLLLSTVHRPFTLGKFFAVDTTRTANETPAPPGENGPSAYWTVLFSPDVEDPEWEHIALRLYEKTAIIIGYYGPLWSTTNVGLLVGIREDVGTAEIQVTRICRVYVSARPDHRTYMDGFTRVYGSWQPVTQMWSVSDAIS
jgi:hypothetical protein